MEINRSIDTNPSPEKREGRQRLVPSAGARAHLIIKVENRTVHCTPLASDTADRGGGGGGGGGYGSIPGVGAEVTGSPCSE